MLKKYNSGFWLTCISMFFFMVSLNVILPEMNDLIKSYGFPNLVGLPIALFTLSAGLSRPFSGKLADYIGRRRVILVGIFVGLVCCMCYGLTNGIFSLLLLRFIHGFSAGFSPTGATALITDVLPDSKRGAAMGIWGMFISLGIGVGQGVSSWLELKIGNEGLFYFAGFLSIFSLLLSYFTNETLTNREPFRMNHLHVKKDEVYEKNVLPVAFVMFFSAICSGIIFVMSPEISEKLNIENRGHFFLFYVGITVLMRLFLGRLSDVFGRPQTLMIGMILLASAMLIIGFAHNELIYSIGSFVFGVATGISSPTIFAWTADLSPSHRRGIGAGTMFIALEFGLLSGTLLTSVFYRNSFETILPTCMVAVVSALIASFYLIRFIRKEKKIISGR